MSVSMNDKIYQEELLEHYKYPKNRKKMESSDFSAGHYNPSCGDRISIQGMIKDHQIIDLGFQGSGCVISQATASMLLECCIGKTIEDILRMTKDDIAAMIGMTLGPTRFKCALLSLDVLHQGLLEYRTKKI